MPPPQTNAFAHRPNPSPKQDYNHDGVFGMESFDTEDAEPKAGTKKTKIKRKKTTSLGPIPEEPTRKGTKCYQFVDH